MLWISIVKHRKFNGNRYGCCRVLWDQIGGHKRHLINFNKVTKWPMNLLGGMVAVTVVVIRNGISDPSSNPGQGHLCFTIY